MGRLSRLLFAISMLAVIALVITACGGGEEEAQPTAAPTATRPAATPAATPTPAPTPTPTVAPPKTGGTLTAVQNLNPFCMDPILACTPGTVSANRGFYNKLVRWNQADGTSVIGDLADSWTVSADGTVYTFKLRPGVKFHDGSDFDAQDVLFSIDRIKNFEKYEAQGLPAQYRPVLSKTQWGVVTNVEAPDPLTVKMTLQRYSNGWFASLLEVSNTLYVVPSNVAPADMLKSPVGTGPYKYQTWENNVVVRGTRNPTYWKKDKAGTQLPYIDGYEIFITNDTTALLAALRTGRALWSRPLNANRVAGQLEKLQAEIPGLQHSPLASTLHTVMVNNRNVFSDPRIRQAIDLALDRNKINAAGFFNVGLVKHGVMIPKELNGAWSLPSSLFDNRPGYRQGDARKPDVEQARQIMAQAGFGPGNPLRARAVVATSGVDIMTVVLDSLKEIYIEPTSEGIFQVSGNDFPELRKKSWDINIFFALSGSDFPGFTFRQHFSSDFNKQGYLANDWDYSDVDPLWSQFDSERDQAKQKEIVNQIQQKFLEKRYQIGMYRSQVFHAWWPALRNMPRTQCCTVADIVEDFEAVWIDRDFKPFGDGTRGDTPRY